MFCGAMQIRGAWCEVEANYKPELPASYSLPGEREEFELLSLKVEESRELVGTALAELLEEDILAEIRDIYRDHSNEVMA